MTKPITPAEVAGRKSRDFPPEVFEQFNAQIAAKWNGRSATVKQDDIARLIAAALNTTTDQVYERHLLDIEEAYEASGWKVTYDKPAFNENYPATFRFEKQENHG
jgi:hypothetical protein